MSNLNLTALKEAEEDLKTRGGGSGLFVRLAQDESKDIRILDPTPSMNGLYYIEVPIWWVGGKPITSPEFIKEDDYVQTCIDEYEKLYAEDGETGERQFKKLLNATKGQGMKLVQKSTGFWIPILEFDWKIGPNGEISGITDDDGNIDPALVKRFITNGKTKILDAKMSLLKSINRQLTTGRVGAIFLDKEKGYNLIVQRAGVGRDTTYTAQKEDQMPMPDEYYGPNALDVVEVAKSTIYTTEYIDAIMANYFESTPIPEEAEYRFPELRESLKSGDAEEVPTTSRRRRGHDMETTEKEPKADSKVEPVKSTTGTRARAGKTETADKVSAGKSRRSLVKDIAATND